MIIYEYVLEYTGDTDGNPATIEREFPVTGCFIPHKLWICTFNAWLPKKLW